MISPHENEITASLVITADFNLLSAGV